jgi:NTE family protein
VFNFFLDQNNKGSKGVGIMQKPKIGLALGSGGARGFAHVGVIKALRDAEIPIDYIAGSSMGALVGAFYGAGMDIEQLYKLAAAFRRKYYLDFTVPKMGFIQGHKAKELIRIFTKDKKIEELDPPVAIVATDLMNGEKVVFKKGSVVDAVRASISIPGIFVPEKIDGRMFVDGGVVDRVPISVAKEMGADIVIAVDVSYYQSNAEIASIFDVIMQSIDIMQNELARFSEFNSDIMVKPNVMQFSSRAFRDIQEIMNIGEQETAKRIPEIKKVIEDWKENDRNEA